MERRDLLDFQRDMQRAILQGDTPEQLVSGLMETGGVPAQDRLDIHYNNFRETLSSSLAAIFPALDAFVGPVFVKGALREFCAAQPPGQASLAGYGSAFADFLANHPASEQVPYVVDLVRLEWAMHELQLVDEIAYNAAVEDEQGPFSVSRNCRLIESDYPLMSLWSAAAGHIPPEAVHLGQGGETVVVLLREGQVSLFALDTAERDALSAISKNKGNNAAGDALGALVSKGVLVRG